MKKNQLYENISSAYSSKLVSYDESKFSTNIVGSVNKHIKLLSPSTKEWPNTVYNYNKSYEESSFFKSQIINKIMRNYFNLVFVNKNNKNSKRMRDLIRRSSTKKLFVSRPEIKHNVDNIIYTTYVFDKEKGTFNKKIFLLNKSLNKFNKYRMYNIKYLNNIENRLELNKIRSNNRFSTINNIFDTKREKQVTSKLYIYKPKTNSLYNKNLLLYKARKGLVYYINSHNIFRQRPLLKLKAKKLKKEIAFDKNSKVIKQNFFVAKTNELKNNLKTSQISKYKQLKNKSWGNLVRNKNGSHFSNKLVNLLTLSLKRTQTKTFKSIFFFNFMLWILNGFNLNVIISNNNLVIKKTNESIQLIKNHDNNYLIGNTVNYDLTNLQYRILSENLKNVESKINRLKISKLFFPVDKINNAKNSNTKLTKLNEKLKTFNTKTNKLKNRLMVLNKIKLNVLNKIKLNKLNKTNNILFRLVCLTLKKGKHDNTRNGDTNILTKNINFLFNQFKKKHLLYALKNTLMKQLLGMHYLYKYSINSFKYNKFLIAIKTALLKIYNKTPKINIVNLKYLHLNSDVLLEAISIKLKNKRTNLLRTIKKALKLVKLPQAIKKNEDNTNLTFNHNKLKNGSGDIVSYTLNKMFSSSKEFKINYDMKDSTKNLHGYLSFNTSNNLVKDIYEKRKNELENLRHKWITGVKIEGKGRLTKRYRADRSLFKVKYKGSLRNINFEDVYNKKHLALKKTQSMTLLKGQTAPNIQYSFAKWKRHIGSYGIKGWISNN